MQDPVHRRSFLKYCLAGGAALLADSRGFSPSAWAGMVSPDSPEKFHPAKTLCGCFNVASVGMAKDLGAQAMRAIFPAEHLDNQMATAQGGHLPRNFQLMKDLSGAGIPAIASYNWVHKQGWWLPEPDSDTWHQWLKTAENFAKMISPYVVGISLDNEPITSYKPTDFLSNSSGVVPAIAWFQALAATIRKTAPQLLISSPGLNTLDSLRAHPKSPMAAAVAKFFDWARNDSNIDVIDIHAHFDSVKTVESVFSHAERQFPRGMVVLEWSQTGRIKGWDESPLNAGFAAKWERSASLKNGDYVLQCEAHPGHGPGDSRVSLEEWNDFVATAPLDEAFMAEAFQSMKKHGVLMAAYGGAQQYGNRLFDVTQLYANLTVPPQSPGKPQPNYKLVDWFKALSATA